jgi:hypothetical protein
MVRQFFGPIALQEALLAGYERSTYEWYSRGGKNLTKAIDVILVVAIDIV